MIRSFKVAAISSILSTVLAGHAWAVQIVVPPTYAATEAQIAAGAILSTALQTNETQYAAAQLTGITVGSQLIGLYWRMNGNVGGGSGPSSAMNFTNFDIYLGQAANSITGMSSTIENNILNPVEVRSGALTIPANSFPGGSSPNTFGPFIQFQTPYTYLGGDLVVLVTHSTDGSSVLTVDGINQSQSNPLTYGLNTTYRALQTSPGAYLPNLSGQTITAAVNEPVPITKFEVVPEPSTWLLMSMGLAGLAAWRWKKSYAQSSAS